MSATLIKLLFDSGVRLSVLSVLPATGSPLANEPTDVVTHCTIHSYWTVRQVTPGSCRATDYVAKKLSLVAEGCNFGEFRFNQQPDETLNWSQTT